jgi:arginyl-tRNA synthetase
MEDIKNSIAKTVDDLFGIKINVELFRPDYKFGDWSTNVAMQLAKQLSVNPKETAQKIVDSIKSTGLPWMADIEIAGPGFINMRVKDEVLVETINDINRQKENYGKNNSLAKKCILVEYLDPNPFKEIHIGHAYSGTVGDAIATLFEASGGDVHRVTYQGDVGLHVAKAMYGILRHINNNPDKLNDIPETKRSEFLGKTYAEGAAAFEENEEAKTEILELNKKIYDQSDPLINKIHETGKIWSMKYFDDVYAAFGFTPFEKNYLEGMVAGEGLKIVKEHIKDGVFKESEGAVVFVGEPFGLHTRVFINSLGLPTYDAKDLGNAMLKWRDYKYDKSIIITGEEQAEYFKVMLKALQQIAPEQANSTTHIPHGTVGLSRGKMSSRTGNVIKALDLLNTAEESASKLATSKNSPVKDTALAAIKYAFLKNRIGSDVVYDVDESLSLEGNSGPYIQYAHSRACSIFEKSKKKVGKLVYLDDAERVLASKLDEYQGMVKMATEQLHPHIICTYLFELAQNFNHFYEHSRIIGDPREESRLALVGAYAIVLKNGLSLLKISAPDRM